MPTPHRVPVPPTHGEVGAGDGDSGLQPQGQVGQRWGRVEAELGPVQGQGVGLGQELLWRHRENMGSTHVWGHGDSDTDTPRAPPGPQACPCPRPCPQQGPTSLWMLGTEAARPLWAPWELLGELGPDPGALLHTEDTAGQGVTRLSHTGTLICVTQCVTH